MLHKTKDLSKICKVSRKQLRIYTKMGLINPTYVNENGWIFFDDYQVIKLFRIEMLQKMQFSLKDIQIIFKANLDEKTFNQMVNHWLNNTIAEYKVFDKSYLRLASQIRDGNLEGIFDKNYFLIFNRNGFSDTIAQEVYDFKTKYSEIKKWESFRKLIKQMFKVFLDHDPHDMARTKRRLEPFFEKIETIFQEETEYKSILFFTTFFRWLIIEPNFVKLMLEITEQNYVYELWEFSLQWICEKNGYKLFF